jgi:hypothetical protein
MTDLIKQKTGVLVMHKTTNYALTALILAAAISYMYFANVAVRTITLLEKTKIETQSLSVDVSEMESKRLTIENSVSTEKAQQLGFVEVNNPTFIMKNSGKTALSFKTD